MKIERALLPAALAMVNEEGYVVIEAKPRAGLTVFLSQVGHSLLEKSAGQQVYVNALAACDHIVSFIGQKLGCSWGSTLSIADFLRDLKKSAPPSIADR